MDDLVASLSSSHIGQEAHDLAALQVQLTEAFGLSGAPVSSFASSSRIPVSVPTGSQRRGRRQPCTTPTARSPATPGMWGDVGGRAGYRSRASSVSTSMSNQHYRGVGGYEDFEDELMVEDLLVPEASMPWSSSVSTSTSTGHHHTTPNTSARMNPSTSIPVSHQPSSISMSMSFSPATSPSSAFALNDPFFLQTQANAQSYFHDNSNIMQHGHPGASSSFATAGF
ncbi:hypothetical protein DFP72DRAFT_854717 [Ephemerocybe angulata]|uniref:Uncharacterized protein n=1 Tax=Ephemerocybe angulata TaxID=980116 RepID=A0A8H6HK54_9AGAR|nr:hypothetical protein DFP72DRAFT_854717 [Tulosesus angulatus]